jgi:hypothetical protein
VNKPSFIIYIEIINCSLCDLCELLNKLNVSYSGAEFCIYRLFSRITHRFGSFKKKFATTQILIHTSLPSIRTNAPPLCDLCGLCGGKRLGHCFPTRKGHLNSCESSYIGMLEGNKKSTPPPVFPPLPPPLWWKTARTLFPNEKGASEDLLFL